MSTQLQQQSWVPGSTIQFRYLAPLPIAQTSPGRPSRAWIPLFSPRRCLLCLWLYTISPLLSDSGHSRCSTEDICSQNDAVVPFPHKGLQSHVLGRVLEVSTIRFVVATRAIPPLVFYSFVYPARMYLQFMMAVYSVTVFKTAIRVGVPLHRYRLHYAAPVHRFMTHNFRLCTAQANTR